MPSVTLTGSDVAVIGGRVLHDNADGDFVALEFPEDLAKMKVSKDGNAVYAFSETGRQVNVTLRLLAGSADDVYFNSLLQQLKNDPAAFALMAGSFTKRVGDGKGGTKNIVYQLAGGIFRKNPGAKSNAEGDTDQGVAVYETMFLNQARAIQ